MASVEDIKKLLKTERFSAGLIPQLEAYLISQVDNSAAYDFEANRTLIKLYQFFPTNSNSDCITVAGLLAMIYGELSEFGAINCLIPESQKSVEPFPLLIRAVESRDACTFATFWSVFDSIVGGDSVNKLVKSEKARTALRKSILNTISLSYKNIGVAQALAHLDIKSEAELKSFVKDNAAAMVENISSDTVTFNSNAENTKRDKVNQDGGVDYSTIRGLMASATVAAE